MAEAERAQQIDNRTAATAEAANGAPSFIPSTAHSTFSHEELTRHANAAFKQYHSVLALSRSPLANLTLIGPALVLDTVSPTADERGRAVRLLLQWAVRQLAPAAVAHPLGTERPFDDPTWRDPRWWRYNILRHRYLEPLHPDQFVAGGRFTETLISLTGIPSTDTFFDERNRAIRDVAYQLSQQLQSGRADATLQRMALQEAYRPLQNRPEAQHLLGIAATFDDVFPRALLLQMADDEHIVQAAAPLDYLIAHRFLLTGDDGRNLWLSPVLQAYVYQRQSPQSLRRRHTRAARHYRTVEEPLASAEHLCRANEWEAAATLLLHASRDLINELQLGELIDALHAFEAQHLPALQWCELQILLSDLHTRNGQPDAAIAACRQALPAAQESTQQARVYRRMGKLYEERNPLHALGYYQQAAERFTPHDAELVDLLKDRAWLYIFRQEWQKAEADLRFALAQATDDSPAQRADIFDALASLHRYQKQYEAAIHYAQQALSLREEMGDLLRVGHSFGNLGLLYNAMGEYRHAIAAYEEALGIFRQQNNQKSIATALLNVGMAHHLDGRLTTAVETYEQSLHICHAVDAPLIASKVHSNLVEAYAELDQPLTAQQHWRAGYDLSVRAGFDEEVDYFLEFCNQLPVLQDVAPDASAPPEPDNQPHTAPSEPRPQDSPHRPEISPEADLELAPDEAVALRIAATEGRVTPRVLMETANVSKATATRRLAGLVDRGYLRKHGKGRGTYYALSTADAHTASPAHARQNGQPSSAAALADLRQILNQQRTPLAERYAIDALGVIAPPAAHPALPHMLDLAVSFSRQPDLPTFFALERHLSELLQLRVDLRPVAHAPASQLDTGWRVHWIW